MEYYGSPVTAAPAPAPAAGMYFQPTLHPAATHIPTNPATLEYMYFPVQVYDDTDYVELELPDAASGDCVSGAATKTYCKS